VGSGEAWHRIALVVVTMRDYWRMMVWPWPLRAVYSDYVISGLAAAMAFHTVLLALAWLGRRRHPGIALGIVFFDLALLPSTKLAATPATLAERFTYLPSVGFAILLAFSLDLLLRGRRRGLVVAGSAVVVAVLMFATQARNRDWRSRDALWEAEARVAPGDWVVLHNLSEIRLAQGRFEEVVDLCERGQALVPKKAGFAVNLGIAFGSLGRNAEAEIAFQKAIVLSGGAASDHANLARLYIMWSRSAQAEEQYRLAVARESNPAIQHALKGELLLHARGDVDGARDEFNAALAMAPGLLSARDGLRSVDSARAAAVSRDAVGPSTKSTPAGR
jgi:hypothetical protein